MTAEIVIHDAQGRPQPGADVRIEANMTHPGMAPVLARAREVTPGRYEAELALDMAGDWYFLVAARGTDGRVTERTIAVPGVRPR